MGRRNPDPAPRGVEYNGMMRNLMRDEKEEVHESKIHPGR